MLTSLAYAAVALGQTSADAAGSADGFSGWAKLAYLVSAVLFILTFKLLAHPRTAARGNLCGVLGMAIAVGTTLTSSQIGGYTLIILGLLIGGGVGATIALRIEMTAMPQMVGLLNGFGGGASLFVAAAELHKPLPEGVALDPWGQQVIAIALSCIIGAVTLTGSLVAFAKLQGIKAFAKPFAYPGQQAINGCLAVVALLLAAWLCSGGWIAIPFWLMALVGFVLGVMLTMPIGGADMPVVICLLNSYSGLAAAATGFVLGLEMLIIAGSLVGASGLILTQIMCKAMNRSLTNVLFGVMGPTEDGPSADDVYAGKIKSAGPEELAMIFDDVRRVVIVPGYGMAVAQAQHAVRELYQLLESRDAEVEFGIHPVAGRMPGHMNVLLAEAEIPYDKMIEMEQINPSFPETDVAIVIGANDVVNPVANTDPNSPIAGMPILEVEKARTVIVVKRSLSPGFAGIPNPLFAADNTLMYFADGKKAILDLVSAIKES